MLVFTLWAPGRVVNDRGSDALRVSRGGPERPAPGPAHSRGEIHPGNDLAVLPGVDPADDAALALQDELAARRRSRQAG